MTRLDQNASRPVWAPSSNAVDRTWRQKRGSAVCRVGAGANCTKDQRNTRPFLSPVASSRPVNPNSSVLARALPSGSELAQGGLKFGSKPAYSVSLLQAALRGNILKVRIGIMNRLKVVSLFLLFALVSAGCSGMVGAGNSSAPVVPSIAAQPTSQTVTSGQAATFTVVAAGTAPLTYQWQKNATVIAGATSSTYTTPSTTASDNGSQFRVVVGNTLGNVTSSIATLSVNAAAVVPSITTPPASQTVTAGQAATFSVVAAGTAPLTYQWKKNA